MVEVEFEFDLIFVVESATMGFGSPFMALEWGACLPFVLDLLLTVLFLFFEVVDVDVVVVSKPLDTRDSFLLDVEPGSTLFNTANRLMD